MNKRVYHNYSAFTENAEIGLINPLYPPILGDFLKAGGHPQTPGRKCPASLFQRSRIRIEIAKIVFINPLIPHFWGIFKAGGHPQTPGRKYPAPLFQRSLIIS
jgi:hypothetical protein